MRDVREEALEAVALGELGDLACAMDAEVSCAQFVPAGAASRTAAGVHVVDARAVMRVLL